MYGNLALLICGCCIHLRNDFADSEFSSHSERERSDYRSRSKVGEMIRVPAHVFRSTGIAIHERGIGLPLLWGLKLELFAIRMKVLRPAIDLLTDLLSNEVGDSKQLWRRLANIIDIASIVRVLFGLLVNFFPRIEVESYGMWRLDCSLEHLELVSSEGRKLGK